MSGFRRRLMLAQGGGLKSNGAYILGIDGNYYTKDQWSQIDSNVVGIAVFDSRHPDGGFVIAPDEINSILWNNKETLIGGISTTTDKNIAKTIFKGIEDTETLVSSITISKNFAAKYCKNYIFKNVKNGYLMSSGEIFIIADYMDEIDECLVKINGTKFNAGYVKVYWTSTQYNSSDVWSINYEKYIGHVAKTNNGKDYYARAICKLN